MEKKVVNSKKSDILNKHGEYKLFLLENLISRLFVFDFSSSDFSNPARISKNHFHWITYNSLYTVVLYKRCQRVQSNRFFENAQRVNL